MLSFVTVFIQIVCNGDFNVWIVVINDSMAVAIDGCLLEIVGNALN